MPARILIADDNSVARTTIRALLDWHSFQVCGDAKDGQEAIDKVIELKPDIVLLDINMPIMDGLTAAREIRRISPATKIVFLTIQDAPAVAERTRLWAHGFVPKSAAGTELIPMLNRLVGVVSGNPRSTRGQARIYRRTGAELKALMERFFQNVFMFSMVDDVAQAGIQPNAKHVFALSCGKKG